MSAARGPDVYVGLMSGTSTDGISAAAARFLPDGDVLGVELLGFVQQPYDASQRARLLAAMESGSARDYCMLGADLGGWLADAAAALLAESGVARADVRAVCSHGQTLWHEPGHSTWQAGESAVIAERLGVDVVSDFRVRDVAAGGQGAPLVPIADALLFAAPEHWRALQNLGGIGNVTVVPPSRGAVDPTAGVRAFDTGPGVAVIDAVARRVRPQLPYDVDGQLARAGTPVAAVVDALLAEPYFAAPPPKSTGRELFSAAYTARLIDDCRAARPTATDEDLVATAVSLTARSVADAYRRFLPEPVREVLLSGGGARNPVLVESIARELAARADAPAVRAFDAVFFDGEAKEAVAFALLGFLHVERRPGNVPGATGARGPRVLGKLTPAG
ncbi:anhydro-N-acetylmuramic acid kinase [Roseisolibacter agri]|uniref:Anhydro-N-acetylmuramic acid kinase n=1 Tax=Roseisolibacter agri TaxID=2014610 RepID=A0AA37V770_9BACT|nr:anhydro-N-acetylmuramic acid kinase [Roseisolibacter agri]GLC26216.1 anhydro-N-acetylmuramic acid kinase [Roseisolibacter agri]